MNFDIEQVDRLIHDVSSMSEEVFNNINKFLSNPDLRECAKKYATNKIEDNNPGFNAFLIMSDLYYRENLHSDILYAILNPNEPHNKTYTSHNEGNLFLKLFIEAINKLSRFNDNEETFQRINLEDYQTVSVTREKHRIDILIEGNEHAIIVENKINNASDTYNQIPKYYKELTGGDYTVDAVVYLSQDGSKIPKRDTWEVTDSLRTEINDKLIYVPAYNKTGKDLYTFFLKECILLCYSSDALLVLKQYSKLVKYLGGQVMNEPIMEKFYDYLLKNENFKIALSIPEMLGELPVLRAKKIADHFRSEVYPLDFKQQNNFAKCEGFKCNNSSFLIWIECQPEITRFRFWDSDYGSDNYDINKLHEVVKILGYDKECKFDGDGEYVKEFSFPEQETNLFVFTDNFIKSLNKSKD